MQKFEKLNETNRKQVELGREKELSGTDESIGDTDVEEEQPDLTTGVLCVITTESWIFGLLLTVKLEVSWNNQQL